MRTCGDVMEEALVYLDEQETVRQAVEVMGKANVAFLPICDWRGRLVGTLTDRALLDALTRVDRPPSAVELHEVMQREPPSCRPDDAIEDALQLMAENRVAWLAVTDGDGTLRGLLTLSELRRGARDAARTYFERLAET